MLSVSRLEYENMTECSPLKKTKSFSLVTIVSFKFTSMTPSRLRQVLFNNLQAVSPLDLAGLPRKQNIRGEKKLTSS
jgi:hypothetical protein